MSLKTTAEDTRLRSLHALELLDMPRQEIFDGITETAADLLDCSIALVSLVDTARQWFLSSVGVDVRETPRDIAFCDHAIAGGCALLVGDARNDTRFSENPLVTQGLRIRSYLGQPIRSPDGALIGTICVADQRPDRFTDADLPRLVRLARVTEELIAARAQTIAAVNTNGVLAAQSRTMDRMNQIFEQAETIARIGCWEAELGTRTLMWSRQVHEIHAHPATYQPNMREALSYYNRSDRKMIVKSMDDTIQTGRPFRIDANLTAADGTVKRVKVMGERVDAEAGSAVKLIGVIQDISDTYQSGIRLKIAADHDSLTGLRNRSAFDRELRHQLRSLNGGDDRLHLLLFDLDGFKDVNDTFGHLVGDLVLEEVSSRLESVMPDGTVAARWGGDEFVVIAPASLTRSDVMALSDSVLQALSQQSSFAEEKISVSATCGIAASGPGMIGKELLRRADLALYSGKAREPGRVHFYEKSLEFKNHTRVRAVAQVRQAIENAQVYAGYQPVVVLHDNELVGLEALLRLTDGTGEEITAGEVLPAFLDPILSRNISDRMIALVCADFAALQATYSELAFISINATEADLLSREFASKLLQRLRSTQLDPGKITLEVTETMLMVNDQDTVCSVLATLRQAGVRIALDDFGTGFSSLSHLRDFPIDKVKIDRSFINSVCDDHQARVIVQALIGMARSMSIDVIAEGIETDAQRDLLARMGCQFGQGFLFGKARSLDNLLKQQAPAAGDSAGRVRASAR